MYQLKDQALFWVYFIEWSTASITGVAAWTLMVRRRLYRDTGRTRLCV